jgi:hypothetical protein
MDVLSLSVWIFDFMITSLLPLVMVIILVTYIGWILNTLRLKVIAMYKDSQGVLTEPLRK